MHALRAWWADSISALILHGTLLLMGFLLPFMAVWYVRDCSTFVLTMLLLVAEVIVWTGYRTIWSKKRLQEALNAGILTAFVIGCVYELVTWGTHGS